MYKRKTIHLYLILGTVSFNNHDPSSKVINVGRTCYQVLHQPYCQCSKVGWMLSSKRTCNNCESLNKARTTAVCLEDQEGLQWGKPWGNITKANWGDTCLDSCLRKDTVHCGAGGPVAGAWGCWSAASQVRKQREDRQKDWARVSGPTSNSTPPPVRH